MTKPAIILVHGFWGGAAHWAKVIPELARQGYTDLHAVEMPLTSLANDAARLKQMIAQQKGKVVLVGHSYGGAVITEAGNQPNVAALVYIAAFAPDVGESAGAITQGNPPAGIAAVVPDSDGYLWVAPDQYHANFCQDLTKEEALVMAVTQKAPVGTTFGDNVTDPAWKHKDCWYQISSADRMINPENQKMMSGRMNAKKVITLDASHASLASRPKEVTDLIVEAAKAVG